MLLPLDSDLTEPPSTDTFFHSPDTVKSDPLPQPDSNTGVQSAQDFLGIRCAQARHTSDPDYQVQISKNFHLGAALPLTGIDTLTIERLSPPYPPTMPQLWGRKRRRKQWGF